MNLISRVKSFIIHYRTRCSCVSRLRTREMFMHSSNTSSPTYELSFPLGGNLLKLFMFDTRFFTRDASLSLYVYIYISSDRMKTIEFLYTNLHHSFILSRFSYHTSTFSPSSCRRFFTGERDEVLFVDLMARARFGRNVFTGVQKRTPVRSRLEKNPPDTLAQSWRAHLRCDGFIYIYIYVLVKSVRRNFTIPCLE